jgi:hypothetical protein
MFSHQGGKHREQAQYTGRTEMKNDLSMHPEAMYNEEAHMPSRQGGRHTGSRQHTGRQAGRQRRHRTEMNKISCAQPFVLPAT